MQLGLLLLAPAFAAGPHAQAAALLHEVFQDHGVLQRDRPIQVWGEAGAGEALTISIAASTVHATADAHGSWRAVLPAMGAGGPYVLAVHGSSGAAQSATDILIGDVFLCSGQSNMELSVLRAADSQGEISNSKNNSIRMLTVEHAVSPLPLTHFTSPVTWEVAALETVPHWSAVCFFFARELQASTHAPIGLLHSSWGGSNIRPWMSAAALRTHGYESALKILATYAQNKQAAQDQFALQWQQWWRDKTGDASGAEPWSAAHVSLPASSTNWRPAPAVLSDWRNWGVPELKNFTGLLWYRTKISLTSRQARAPATLNLGPVNQVDQTWINGRPIGNTFGYETERTYRIAAGVLHAGENVIVINVLSTYGAGGLLDGHATRELRLEGGAPIALNGLWEYRMVPSAIGYPPRAPWESVGGLTTLYNAMIAPLGPYGLRGALWYQGESNTGEADSYRSLLSGLMSDWRRQFDPQLPFLVVQLPNFGPQPTTPVESGWAAVREAERLAVAQDAHAALAVTIDIGEAHNLHPTNKQDVGRRLARAARRAIYGESISPSGPVALGAGRSDGQIAVKFGDVESGLVAYSHDSPIGFELCADAPGTCRFAEARIDGVQVALSAPTQAPTRVRYCWADSPVCTLFDGSGLPAGPFELRIQP
ncbi:MAG TPA: sialate O-acetylesterase [Steroidobacteraceae bacterium]|jgi:sialate O-acetylesterase